MGKKGFTLIELIMVIVILGIIAAIALPKYIDLSYNAKLAAAKGAYGTIRAAASIQYGNNAINGSAVYPATLQGTMFAEGVIPTNPLSPSSNAVVTTFDGLGGWVYTYSNGSVESNDASHTVMN